MKIIALKSLAGSGEMSYTTQERKFSTINTHANCERLPVLEITPSLCSRFLWGKRWYVASWKDESLLFCTTGISQGTHTEAQSKLIGPVPQGSTVSKAKNTGNEVLAPEGQWVQIRLGPSSTQGQHCILCPRPCTLSADMRRPINVVMPASQLFTRNPQSPVS